MLLDHVIPNALPGVRACLISYDPKLPTKGARHTIVRDVAIVGYLVREHGGGPVLLTPARPEEWVLLRDEHAKSWTTLDGQCFEKWGDALTAFDAWAGEHLQEPPEDAAWGTGQAPEPQRKSASARPATPPHRQRRDSATRK